MPSYFFRVPKGADLSQYQAQHDLIYPGNKVAALPDAYGGLLVKVAYAEGTPMPQGAISFAAAKAELDSIVGNV